MSFKPTEEQRVAIETLDKNLMVSAGAGSGKTRVLVERFIYIIREGYASFHEVLAITFTRKAAREMEDRVRKTLDDLIRKAPSLEDKAKWVGLKEEAEGARISTIHSFCSKILKENPVEAGIDPDFGLMEEADSQYALEAAAVAALMASFDEENKAAEALLREYGFENLITQICNIYPVMISKGERVESLKEKALFCKHNLVKLHSDLKNRLIRVVDDIIEINTNTQLAKKTSESISDLEEAWPQIRYAINYLEPSTAELEMMEQIASLNTFISGNCAKAVKPYVMEMKNLIEEFLGVIWDLAAFPNLEGLIDILEKTDSAYRRCKKQLGLLDYGDLETEALRLLSNNPRVLTKYRNGFKFIMVDEFQDTNELQKNMIYLLSSDDTGKIVPGKLFLVGDGKQSIYRFRGADVEVFSKVHKEITQEASGQYIRLSKNFRSASKIIDFVNGIFSSLMTKSSSIKEMSSEASASLDVTGGFEIGYEPLEAQRNFSKEEPFIELIIVNDNKEDLEAADIEATPREIEADFIAQRIRAMIDDEEMLATDNHNKLRPVKFGDIAILFRASTDMPLYEKSLLEMDIPYYVIGGLGFYEQQEIKDVMNALKSISNLHDIVSLVGLLRSPFFGISDETLFWLAEDGGIVQAFTRFPKNSYISLEEKAKLTDAKAFLSKFRILRRRLSPSRLIESVLDETDFCQVLLSQFGGKQRYFNVKKLINIAKEFEIRDNSTLEDFIEYVNFQREIEVAESQAHLETEGGDVVSLLTVHKAKGLEFPVVIIADMGRNPNYERSPFLLDNEYGLAMKGNIFRDQINYGYTYGKVKEREQAKDEAESRRLFYVAITRAKDHLIMVGPASKVKPDKNFRETRTWMEWITSVSDIAIPELEETSIYCNDVEVKVHFPKVLSMEEHIASQTVSATKSILSPVFPLIQPICTDEELGKRRRVFAVTALSTFYDCPRRYYLDHVLSLPGGVQSGDKVAPLRATDLGQIMHLVFEKAQSVKEAHTLVESILEGISPNALKEVREDIYTMVEGYFSSHLFQRICNAKRVWNEWPFHLRIGDYVVVGKMDKIIEEPNEDLTLIDFKTDSLKGRDVKTVAEAYRFQITLYALALKKLFGKMPSSSIVYLVRPKNSYFMQLTDETMATAEKKVEELISSLKNSDSLFEFPKSSSKYCEFCPKYTICESLEVILGSLLHENL